MVHTVGACAVSQKTCILTVYFVRVFPLHVRIVHNDLSSTLEYALYSRVLMAEDRFLATVEYGLSRIGQASLTFKPEQLDLVAGYTLRTL